MRILRRHRRRVAWPTSGVRVSQCLQPVPELLGGPFFVIELRHQEIKRGDQVGRGEVAFGRWVPGVLSHPLVEFIQANFARQIGEYSIADPGFKDCVHAK